MEVDVRKNLESIEKELAPFAARLLPVSKTFPVETIRKAYDYGYREFGENRVQELVPKAEALPSDIHWHLIGHLQTNKVKYIAPFIACIHSVDSEKLLAEIDRQAARCQRKIPCLLQVYIAREDTKSGWDPEELVAWFEGGGPGRFPHVEIRGLMGMASLLPDPEDARPEFRKLKQLFDLLARFDSFPNCRMEELSMGMSGDYLQACQEGSTLVRMGTAVFGGRFYPKSASEMP